MTRARYRTNHSNHLSRPELEGQAISFRVHLGLNNHPDYQGEHYYITRTKLIAWFIKE